MSAGGNGGSRLSPLLKWPGGKRVLLDRLLPLIPKSFNRYYEPFLGGGALYFALCPYPASLSDTNEDLMTCYRVIRDSPEALVRQLERFRNSAVAYARVRTSRPRSDVGRAARLIYLSTLSFNGIYRVNLRGEFNVPYGRKTWLAVARRDRILAASAALQGRTIACRDFESAVADAGPNDLVYLDPPYTVAHDNNGFIKYNARIFSWQDQTRLAQTAAELARRGCHVILTNAYHPSIQDLYRDFTAIDVKRPSRIAASSEHRRYVRELILTNVV